MDLEKAVRRAQEGNLEDFCTIVASFEVRVRGYIARFVANQDDVFDLSQEVFLAAFRRFDSFDPTRNLGAWLFGIAKKLTVDHLRKCARTARQERNFFAQAVHRWQSVRLEALEEGCESMLRALRLCLNKLPALARRLVQRRYLEGVSAESIAGEKGVNASTVRMSLLRVREALRVCVRQHVKPTGESDV